MLTERQKEALAFIGSTVKITGGVPPSYRELQTALGLKSVTQARDIVLRLEERGFIRRCPARAKAIEIVDRNPPQPVPIVRVVPCRWFAFDPVLKQLVAA